MGQVAAQRKNSNCGKLDCVAENNLPENLFTLCSRDSIIVYTKKILYCMI